jgi:hypothetical protein
MEYHEYANIYRMLPERELNALADDIKSKGQLLPITSYEGKILDGRNRYRACQIAGIEPRIEEYTGDDPLGLIASLNDHRRHDTENERALVGARMANLRQGGERGNQYTGGKKPTGHLPAITIARAAELSGSSKKNIQRAKPIVQSAIPELVDMVETGEVSIRAGSELAKLPEDEQRKAVAGGVAGVKEAAKKLSANPPSTSSESADGPSINLERTGQGQPSTRPPRLKIAHAMGIFLVAKNHMDKISTNDTERKQALQSMIDYCNARLSKNK